MVDRRKWAAPDATDGDPWWGVYARISDAQDKRDTAGVDRQTKDSLEEAIRLGARRVRFYVDNNLSAYDQTVIRDDWQDMLGDIKVGTTTNIVGWKVERLARQPRDAEALIDVLGPLTKQRAVAYTTDGVDTSTQIGRFLLRQFVQFGEWESARISARVTRKHAELRDQGMYPGGPPTFGHLDGTKWREIEPTESALLQDAAARIVAGEGVMSILRDWSSKGVKTRRGAGWQHAAFRNLITAPRMAGLRSVDNLEQGVDEKGVPWIAPILDQEVWLDVRRILLDPGRRPNAPGGTARHLLTNLIRCGLCRVPLRAKGNAGKHNGPNYWTYGCVRDPYHESACGKVWIKGDQTDTYMTGVVLAHLRLPAVRSALTHGTAGAEPVDEETSLRRDALDLRDKITAGEVALLEGPAALEAWGGVSPEGFRRWRKIQLERLDDLDKRIGRSVRSRSIVRAIADPDLFWSQATLSEKRDVIRAVLPEIKVMPASSVPSFPQRWDRRRIDWTPAG